MRAEKPPAHPLQRLGSDADGELDAAIFSVAARHHFCVFVEPVQPLTVRRVQAQVDEAAARAPAYLRSPR